MVFRKKLSSYLRLAIVLPLLASTQPNCLGLSKIDGAADAGSATATTNYLSLCPGSTVYTRQADQALQNRCVTCHAPNSPSGQSAAYSLFSLIEGTDLNNNQLNSNYAASLAQLSSNYGGSDLTTNPILANPLGMANNHTTIFASQTDSDYIALYGWVSAEQASPCSDKP
jgi:hypothetical protein